MSAVNLAETAVKTRRQAARVGRAAARVGCVFGGGRIDDAVEQSAGGYGSGRSPSRDPVITPRQTRLFRAADLRAFQRTIRRLAGHTDVWRARSCAVIVPSAAAADQLRRTFENHRLLATSSADRALCLPQILTRSGWYDAMHSRLPSPPRRLTDLEREVLLNAAARDVAASEMEPPFRLRAGLARRDARALRRSAAARLVGRRLRARAGARAASATPTTIAARRGC